MVRNFYKRFLIILAVVAGVVFLNKYFLNDFLQNFVYKAVKKPGVFLTENLLRFSKYSQVFLRTKQTADEDARLREENNILRGQTAEVDNLKRENRFLRDELGVAKRLEAPLLLVQLLGIQRNAAASTALINKGSKDGIKKSMAVIMAGNVLAGIVNQVFDDSSSILLLDDPRVKISGRVQESQILVSIRGSLQNRLNLELVSNSEEIKEGDSVVSSGLDGLPESLLIAKVSKVESPGGALFKSVTAQPFFDPSLGSSLFVILK